MQLHTPTGSGLHERVIGQVSDLPLVILTGDEAEAQVSIDIERAGPLSWRITVRDRGRDWTETREVVVDDEQPFAQSAVDETAAVVVRVMLQTLLREASAETVEATPNATEPASTNVTEPTTVTPLVAPVTSPEPAQITAPASADDESPRRIWLGVSARLALADRELSLWPGVDLWLGAALGAVTLGARGGFGLDVTTTNDIAEISVARHALFVVARVQAIDARWAALGAWLELGTHVFVRRTEHVASGWQAVSAQASWTPAAGLGGLASLALWRGGLLVLGLGAHVQLTRPVVTVVTASGASRTLLRGAAIVPTVWLGLELFW